MQQSNTNSTMQGHESTEKNINFSNVFKLAGAIITALIGSGFSSGEESLQFFSVYGIRSLISGAIASVIFALALGLIMRYGFKNPFNPPKTIFRHYLGKIIGSFLNLYIPVLAFLIGVVTISGSGAAINQYFGLDNFWGTLIMSTVVLFAVLLGFNRLINLLGALGPLTVIAALFIGLYTLVTNYDGIQASEAFLQTTENLPYGAGNSMSFWLLGGILFISYNILGGVPFISKLGSTSHSRKEGFLGGFFGGIGLMLAAMSLNLAMLTDVEQMLSVEVPVLYLAQSIHPIVGILFIYVLLQEMFTTSCAFIWTVSDAVTTHRTPVRLQRIVIIANSVITFIVAQLPFRTLVNIVYPISGYIGLIFLTALIIKEVYLYFTSDAARA